MITESKNPGPTTLECAQCHATAKVEDGKVVRSCQCNAPVVANLQAVATGEGGM